VDRGDDAAELVKLATGDVTALTEDQLIAAIQWSEEIRKTGRQRTGRLLAELYKRGRVSCPEISRLTGVRQTTAYELAQPHLSPDEGDEKAPD
jgi:hypothetical protein